MRKSGSKEFLRRKEKYDPQKSLKKSTGGGGSDINQKNVDKKRIFKSKGRAGAGSDSDSDCEQRGGDQDQDIASQDDYLRDNKSRRSGVQGDGSTKNQKSKFYNQS